MYLVAGSMNANWFMHSGQLAADTLAHALQRQGTELSRLSAVLDFGCGAGRVLQHLRSFPDLALYGCDYNPKLIEWCRSHLRFAEFEVNGPLPPLPYPDEKFDLSYAFSVFTHMTVEQQRLWLAEFARILRPGGVLVLSTHGDAYAAKLTPEQRERYAAGEIVVTRASRRGKNDCAAYHPPAACRQLLHEIFRVLEFVPQGATGNPVQDLWVCRKAGVNR